MFRILFGFGWLLLFANEFWNFFISAICVNEYFLPKVTNVRLFVHSLGHHIGSIARMVFLKPFRCLSFGSNFVGFLKYFGFNDYTIIYIGSEDVCAAW